MDVTLVSFAVTAIVLIVLPGPDTTVVLRAIARNGRAGGVHTAAGVCCGLLTWLLAAVAGLSALLAASRGGYDALKLAGAVYLGWLGVRTLLASMRARSDSGATDVETSGTPAVSNGSATGARPGRSPFARGGFLIGLTTDMLNPKVGVLFVTLMPQFVPHGEPVTRFILLLGALYIAGTAMWFMLLIRLAARIAAWLRRPHTQRWLERVTGVALLGFAVGLVIDPG